MSYEKEYYIKTNLNEGQLSRNKLRKIIPERLHGRVNVVRVFINEDDVLGEDTGYTFKLREEF